MEATKNNWYSTAVIGAMTAVVVGGMGIFTAGRKYEKMEAQKDSSDNFNMVQ